MLGGMVHDAFSYYIPLGVEPYTTTSGLTQATVTPTASTFIGIIEGQSLAANHIPYAYTVQNPTKVFMLNWPGDRLLYRHHEPMLGGSFTVASAIPGNNWDLPYISLWGKVGDLLIAAGYDKVIWANTAVGGAQAVNFSSSGVFVQRMPMIMQSFRMLGIEGSQVNAVLSMLGESDASIPTNATLWKTYRREARRNIAQYGFKGKWFVPLETYAASQPSVASIRQAQRELGLEEGFAPGPDFDPYGSDYRDANGTHQNAQGHNLFAQLWASRVAEELL